MRDDDDRRDEIDDLRSRSPGEHETDPYEDVDVDALPPWWRSAIEEFEAHDLRPYRPSRFADGVPIPAVVDGLEAELGVEIEFICFHPESSDTWDVRVDGTTIQSVDYRRSPEGYSVFDVESDAFEALVHEHD